jgi:cytidylate kinase
LKKRLLITIDGPAGAGKTTTSRILADRLGYRYIDTGALYRSVAVEVQRTGTSPDDDAGLKRLCRTLSIKFTTGEKGLRIFSQGSDITDQIRTPEISMLASAVSAKPVVRKYLLNLQREMGREGGAVFEGRDMGTVVFPGADVKFFLNASLKIRARRRYLELVSTSSQTLVKVEQDMQRRDENDSSRSLAPLKPAQDAIIIDSSELSVDKVVERMLSFIEKRLQPSKHNF